MFQQNVIHFKKMLMHTCKLRVGLNCLSQCPLSRKCFHQSVVKLKSAETALCKQLIAKIRLTGPITVADYMKEVLTNPVAGYYMNRDVLGAQGDFITSPEISQMFGELIGIWCVNEWMQCGSPNKVQLVELGPGRGTLAADILRVFGKFKKINDAVSVHLVEVSPKLSQMQEEKLKCHSPVNATGDDAFYKKCQSRDGPEVSWYHSLRNVPKDFSFYIAHEFFDALPVHIFKKHNHGKWCEVLVDVDYSSEAEHPLRFLLSTTPTTALQVLLQANTDDNKRNKNNCIELCPEGGVLVSELTDRIAEDGGLALVADYGHIGEKEETFRAFKQHQLYHPLCEPGTADLTADVDFSYFKRLTDGKVTTSGPVTQGKFLRNMGIDVRLQVLLKNATPEDQKSLLSGYDMLVHPDKMGQRFKFFSIMEHRNDEYIPAGFAPV